MLDAFGQLPVTRSELANRVHGPATHEVVDGLTYLRVTSEVDWVKNPNALWVSVGASLMREKILFNENSAIIQLLKQTALIRCQRKSIDDVFSEVNNIINELTYVPGQPEIVTEDKLDKSMDRLLERYYIQGEPLYINMDNLIKGGLLLCRHKALLACALLRHLVEKEILPPGTVRQYRSDLKQGAHTWAMYRNFSSGHLHICDPRGRLYGNVSTSFNYFVNTYTLPVLQFMIQRLDGQDFYLKFRQKMQDEVIPLPFNVSAAHNPANPASGLYVQFTFKTGAPELRVMIKALKAHNIKLAYNDSHIYISMAQNPAIYALDIDKLLFRFRSHCPITMPMKPKPLLFRKTIPSLEPIQSGFDFNESLRDYERLEKLGEDYVTSDHMFSRFTMGN